MVGVGGSGEEKEEEEEAGEEGGERAGKVAKLEGEIERLRSENLRWQQVCCSSPVDFCFHSFPCWLVFVALLFSVLK